MTDEQEAAFQAEYRTAITRAESDEDLARRMFEAGMCFAQVQFTQIVIEQERKMAL